MKPKHYGKYIGFMIAISCTSLISIKSNTSIAIITEDKPRIFIKSPEKTYIQNSKQALRNEGVQRQITNGTSEVQLLPTYDTNSPILATPLLSEKS